MDGEADEQVGGGLVDQVLDAAFEGWVEAVASLASEPDVLTGSGSRDANEQMEARGYSEVKLKPGGGG